MVGEPSTNGVLDEVTSWLSQADQLRERLLAERVGLVARLKQIDDALAKMPGAPVATSGAAALEYVKGPIDLKKAPFPALVQMTVEQGPGWMTSGDVAESLNKLLADVGRSFERTSVYSALYKLSQAGVIRGQGEHGSRRYAAKEAR